MDLASLNYTPSVEHGHVKAAVAFAAGSASGKIEHPSPKSPNDKRKL